MVNTDSLQVIKETGNDILQCGCWRAGLRADIWLVHTIPQGAKTNPIGKRWRTLDPLQDGRCNIHAKVEDKVKSYK